MIIYKYLQNVHICDSEKKAFMYKKRILAQFLFLWDVLQLMTKQSVCFWYWNSAGEVKNYAHLYSTLCTILVSWCWDKIKLQGESKYF